VKTEVTLKGKSLLRILYMHAGHLTPQIAPMHGGTLRFWDPETFDAFENIDGLVLSKEVLSFRTFGGLSFEEF